MIYHNINWFQKAEQFRRHLLGKAQTQGQMDRHMYFTMEGLKWMGPLPTEHGSWKSMTNACTQREQQSIHMQNVPLVSPASLQAELCRIQSGASTPCHTYSALPHWLLPPPCTARGPLRDKINMKQPALARAVSQHTDATYTAKATLECYALHGWGLSSAVVSSLCNSVHPPELETNPLKMTCGCPRDGEIKSHPLECFCQCAVSYWNAFVNVQSHTRMHFSM